MKVDALLKHGADLHIKTKKGMNNIFLASVNGNESLIKMFLKNGLQINERFWKGKTALHEVCYPYWDYEVRILFKYGADLNIMNDDGNTPLMIIAAHVLHDETRIKEALAKELAKLKFDGKFICSENLKWLQEHINFRKNVDDCLEELQRMKDTKFYNNYTLYSIIKLKKYLKKLTFLAKNEDFVLAFESSKKCNLSIHYQEDLDEIFNDALERKNILQADEKKMYLIFKELLPELVISKVVYYLNEDLFTDIY